jgi:hypothetical protein
MMRTSLASTHIDAHMRASKGMIIGFWTVTAIFCLQIGFTAYAQMRLAQVAAAFAHLGFPDYFRLELTWAKLLGVVLLLAPVPARVKEWAYAGFAITIGSALIAHLSVGDTVAAWGWAAGRACCGRCRTSCGAACLCVTRDPGRGALPHPLPRLRVTMILFGRSKEQTQPEPMDETT